MNINLRTRLLASTLLVGSAAYASPAFAQASPASASPEVAQAQAQAVAEPSQQEIVVTGSRIARPDLEATSPTAVIGSQEFQLQAGSANVENVLNDLPQVTPTTSSTSNNPGGGVATVNLRGLGSQRTLVLVDGRRYMSFDVTQIVDLNTIPSALIDRVDVVTGGQSAVYGSDAIAGVVNFVLKRNFAGVDLRSSYDITERGDGQIWDVSGTIGTNMDDGRGNVTIFAQYTKRKPTFAGERDFSRFALSDAENGTPLFAAGGSPSVPQGRFNLNGFGAASGLGCNNVDFTEQGAARCFVAANGYNFAPINYLQVPQERFLISAMGQYEINDYVKPYIEAQFANNRVDAQLAATPVNQSFTGPLTIQTNSPFVTPATRAAFAALDTDNNGYINVGSYGFRTVALGPRANFDERNAFRLVGGVKGDLISGFSYDAYYMYARTKNTQRQLGNIAVDRFLFATQTAFQNPATGATSPFPIAGLAGGGTVVCADAGARAAGCVPANIFGLNNLSQAAIDYLSIGATNIEQYTTQVASFAVTNPSLFDLGAGGVGVALGAEWRSENGSVTPDTYLASGNVAGFNPGQPTAGGYSVREFFGEVRVPLLRDNIVHRLELNGAARASHYSNAPGNVFTWAAGAELSPVADITFRGQYQKAVRGPSVSELFLGQTVSFNGNADQCGTAAAISNSTLNAICRAQFTAAGAPVNLIGNPAIQDPNNVNPVTFIGGNEDLREETAKTYTVGAVFQPRFLPRFSATIDYYNIKIGGYIPAQGVGTNTIGNLCFIQFQQNYCSRITRNSTGEIDSFTDTLSNSGGLKTAGVDVSAGYNLPLGSLLGQDDARLSFSFTGSRLLKNKFKPVVDNDLVIDCEGKFGANCGVPTPKWRHTFRTTLGLGDASVSAQWRYIGKARDDDPDIDYGSEVFKAQNYIDLSGQFDVTDNFQFNLGVSNLFDKKPPLAASTQNGGNGEQSNTFPTLYDVLGRAYFVSARIRY